MRREAEEPLPGRDGDPLPLQVGGGGPRVGPGGGAGREDPGAGRAAEEDRLPAEAGEPVQQDRVDGGDPTANRLDPDLEEEVERGREGVDAGRRQRADLEPRGIGDVVDHLADLEVAGGGALHVQPTGGRAEPLPEGRRREEDPAPLGPQHPLVAVGRQEVGLRPDDVDRNGSDGLDRVEAEDDPAGAAERADLVHGRDEPGVEADGRERDEASPRPAGGLHLGRGEGAVQGRDPPDLDAVAGQVEPRGEVRGELGGGRDDRVPGRPVEARGHHREAGRRGGDDGHGTRAAD